jgi:hypothetical protein
VTEASVEFAASPDVCVTQETVSGPVVERKHYVYVIRHNGEPVYVGLGQGDRHVRSCRRCAKELGVGADALTIELREGLTRSAAMKYEVGLIAQFGRRADGGPLLNRALGGNSPSPQCVAKRIAARLANGTYSFSLEARANMSAAGRRVWADERHREKMSAAHRGQQQSPEHRAKIGAAHLGQKRSPEARAQMSAAQRRRSPESFKKGTDAARAANIGRKHTPESRANMAAANIGRTFSAETRAKISAAHKGKPKSLEAIAAIRAAMTPEVRAKISAAHKGRVLSPEHLAKLTAANRRPKSPETLEKMRVSARNRPVSAETRAKLSEATRASWANRRGDA